MVMRALFLFILAFALLGMSPSPPIVKTTCNEQLRPNPLKTWLQTRTIGPRSVIVNNKTYTNLTRLGQGGEGTVYLAHDGDRLVAIKEFYSFATQLEEKLKDFRRHHRLLPKVLDIDRSVSMIVMEYRAGVPMNIVNGRWADLGLTETEHDEISIQFKKWIKVQTWYGFKIFRPSFEAQNIVYSFTDKTFYLIDPY